MHWQPLAGPFVDFSHAFVLLALNVLVQSTAVILLGLAAAWALRSKGAALVSAVYRTTLVAAILCPVASLCLQGAGMEGLVVSLPEPRALRSGNVDLQPSPAGEVAPGGPASDHVAGDGAYQPLTSSVPFPEGSPGGFVSAEVTPGGEEAARTAGDGKALVRMTCGLTSAWMVIVAALLVRVLVAYGRLLLLRKTACRSDPEALAECRAVAGQMGARVPCVLRSRRVSSPMLIGFFRPAILLPKDGTLEGPALRKVLVHEMAHLARNDCLWCLLCRLTGAVLFFQPLLWWLTRRIVQAAEEVCDDYVVDFGIDRRDYARELVAIAERHQARASLVGVGVVSLKSRLGRRVGRILDSSRRLSTSAGRRALLATVLIGLGAAVLIGLLRLGEARLQAASSKDAADPEVNREVPAVALGSDSSDSETAKPSETLAPDSNQRKPGGGALSSPLLTAYAASFPDRPRTEADRIVAAARARSLGLEKLQRFLVRGTYWHGPVVDMQKLPERSLENLWKVRGKEVDASERLEHEMTVAWEGARLLFWQRTLADGRGRPSRTYCHYWDGTEGWIGRLSEDPRVISRTRLFRQVFDVSLWSCNPSFVALSNRLAWPGEVLTQTSEPVHPSLARYQRVGAETIDGQPCEVFDGPARYERIWIEKSTGRLKAIYYRLLHRSRPEYYTDQVREVVRRTFEDRKAYAAWIKRQPEQLRAILCAHSREAHWALTEPIALMVFSDYRQVAPGVEWPMRCERLVLNYAGQVDQEGFRYIRGEIVYDEATTEAPFDPLVAAISPREGDRIGDIRFDVPVSYEWKEGLTEAEIQALVDEERRKKNESQTASPKDPAGQEGNQEVPAVPLDSDSSDRQPAQPSETSPRDSNQQKPVPGASSSSPAMAHAAAFRDRPLTEADRIVAAARARSLGIEKLPRFLLRGTYWNAPVVGMQKLPERSLENLWKVRGREVDTSERYGSKVAIAWEAPRLAYRKERAFLNDTGSSPHTSCRYWDGTEGWSGSLSEDSRTVARYWAIGELTNDLASVYLPNFRALSNRLPWPGEVLMLKHEPVHPSLTRYQRVGAETIDGEPCDVFDGPARSERIWIEKSTGRIKAVYRWFVHRVLPEYYTDLVREVAGRTFEGREAFAAWIRQQPKELQAILSAYWGEVHRPVSKPGNLLVFSDYRQVAPGVEWPMRCERILVHSAGRRAQDGFNYFRCVTVFDEATTELSLDPLVADTLPRQGDKIWDHRFDVSADYEWKEGLTEADVQALVDEKRRELRESQALIAERQRPLNEMVGKPAPPLPESGWLVDSESPIAKRLSGRPYLLHFWATWCGPCKNELPRVQSLHESGLVVIGVHPAGGGPEQAKEIQAFVREQGLEYPQLLAASDDQNVAGYPIGMYPYSVVVDADGSVAAHDLFLKPELIGTLRRLEKKKQP